MTLCGITAPNHLHRCTREAGHFGPHIATIGPYHTSLPVLAEWGGSITLRGGQPGGGKETALRLQAIRQALEYCGAHADAYIRREGRADEEGQQFTAIDDLRWVLALVEGDRP